MGIVDALPKGIGIAQCYDVFILIRVRYRNRFTSIAILICRIDEPPLTRHRVDHLRILVEFEAVAPGKFKPGVKGRLWIHESDQEFCQPKCNENDQRPAHCSQQQLSLSGKLIDHYLTASSLF